MSHDPEDMIVPKPNMASPCWAEANWVNNKNPKMGANNASFLKIDLQSIIAIASREMQSRNL